MPNTSRRSFIMTAAFGTAVPGLVKAESLLDLPGDPLTARGLFAAEKYAQTHYSQNPGCRLVFSDGSTTRWMNYERLSRPAVIDGLYHSTERVYAVALEVAAPQADGRRYVTSVAVDNAMVRQIEQKKADAGYRPGHGRVVSRATDPHLLPGHTRVGATV